MIQVVLQVVISVDVDHRIHHLHVEENHRVLLHHRQDHVVDEVLRVLHQVHVEGDVLRVLLHLVLLHEDILILRL